MNILFRCDGSVEIGMGHVMRCLALADELRANHGAQIYFAMRQSTLGINKVSKSYPVLEQAGELDKFNYLDWLKKCIRDTDAQILILDCRDGLTRQELEQIKKDSGIKVVTIDDPENKRLAADLALYPPVSQLESIDWSGYNGDLRIGWEYVILKSEFHGRHRKKRRIHGKILVSMGGTDPFNLTGLVAEALNHISDSFTATFIVGPGYRYMNKLEKVLDGTNYNNNVIQDPENICQVMADNDMAIVTFGQTAYELAVLDIPALYICLTGDHCQSAEIFVKEGFGSLIGEYQNIDALSIITKVESFLLNYSGGVFNKKLNRKPVISDMKLISSLIIDGT